MGLSLLNLGNETCDLISLLGTLIICCLQDGAGL
jgi:hypothetical protein